MQKTGAQALGTQSKEVRNKAGGKSEEVQKNARERNINNIKVSRTAGSE